MSTRDQFGKYLLLKKLTEDPLGETFRAGQVGAQGMDRVVLLRVFNGPGLRGDELWQGISERKGLLDILRSPNLGEGVDAGQVHGVPYVAWDYVSGKDLRTLLDQAEKQFSAIPTDQALLIAERMALGLEVAHGTHGPDGQRVLHGFLVPHLVLVSNEGDTRLLGFEAASALRRLALASPTANHFRPFVSPEAQAGGPPTGGDDTFALGAMLFELLTGQKLPPASAEGYDPVVDRATLANEGTALPAEIAGLIKKSLAPAAQRIGDVTAWHKEISKILFEGSYNPTTFNLAFFMHNLFRDDIEKESEEIEAERTMEVPIQPAPEPAPAVATPEAPAAPAAAPAPPEDTAVFRDTYGLEDEKAEKKRTGWILGGIAAAVIVLAVAFFAMRGGDGEPAQDTVAAPPPTPAVTVPAEPDPAVVELESKMAQLQTLIEQQQAMLEESQKQQTAATTQKDAEMSKALAEIQELQQQLQETQRQKEEVEKAVEEPVIEEVEEAEPEPLLAETEGQADPAAATQVGAPAATEPGAPAATEPGPPATAEPGAASPTGTQVAQQTPPAAVPGQSRPRQTETPPTTSSAPASTTPSPPVQKPPTPQPAAAGSTARVRVGELVEPGPGVKPPILQKPPRPRFPAMAKRLNKRATVAVNVLVDEKGRVIDARLKQKKKAGFGFDEAALQAARSATYKPATKDGVPVKIWVELRIAFQ